MAYTPQLEKLNQRQQARLERSRAMLSSETPLQRIYRFTDGGHATGFVVGLRNEGINVILVQYK